MFFNEEEMKVAEDLAWKMLDGWNHSYMPNLDDYAHFYFKDQIIFDPWMNEEGQGLPWPDHESKEVAVDPVKYYGEDTIEDFIADMFLRWPEWAPDITERIKGNLGSNGFLVHYEDSMPIIVYIAMSEQQAREEHRPDCLGCALPFSEDIYYMLGDLPADLVHVYENGWEKKVSFLKKDAKKVMKLLYPKRTKFDYMQLINRVYGEEVFLIGFGD